MPTNAPRSNKTPEPPASPIADKPEWARLAAALKARREELDLTQAEVTIRAKISHSTYTPIETLKSPYTPSVRTLRKIAGALDWTPQSCELILSGKKPQPAKKAAEPEIQLDAFSIDVAALRENDPEAFADLERTVRRLAAPYLRGK